MSWRRLTQYFADISRWYGDKGSAKKMLHRAMIPKPLSWFSYNGISEVLKGQWTNVPKKQYFLSIFHWHFSSILPLFYHELHKFLLRHILFWYVTFFETQYFAKNKSSRCQFLFYNIFYCGTLTRTFNFMFNLCFFNLDFNSVSA